MNLKKYTRIIAIVLLYATFIVTSSNAKDMSADRLVIYVVNYPLKYFAERIGGEHVTVFFPAPPDVDPAYWMPDRKTISDYQKADLILLNGADYAKWTEKVTLPRSKVIDTSRRFNNHYIRTKTAVTHNHGPKGKHAHENVAFTTWLDFEQAAKQAQTIEVALSRKRPEISTVFQKNYSALKMDLMSLDGKIMKIVVKDPHKPLIVSHPVYDYLAARYGLNIKSLHWEPRGRPSGAQWIELENILKKHPAQWMIWENEPLEESVRNLESMGVNSIIFNSCGNIPEKGNFLEVMKRNIENLKEAF